MAIGAAWADGAWVDAGWVVGAWVQTSTTKTIGGTSQLEAFASSGGIEVVLPKTIGGASQLEAFSSTGGLDVVVPKTIGGVSQLEAFTSSGAIDSGVPVVVAVSTPHGRPRRRRKALRLPDGRITFADDNEIRRLLEFYKVPEESLEIPMETRRQKKRIKNKAIPAPEIIEELEEDEDMRFIVMEVARLLQ